MGGNFDVFEFLILHSKLNHQFLFKLLKGNLIKVKCRPSVKIFHLQNFALYGNFLYIRMWKSEICEIQILVPVFYPCMCTLTCRLHCVVFSVHLYVEQFCLVQNVFPCWFSLCIYTVAD